MQRRTFFGGAALGVASAAVAPVALAALPEAVTADKPDTAAPLVPSTGRPYRPVVTLNGWTLPWRMRNNVKEFHLVAEPVVRELALPQDKPTAPKDRLAAMQLSGDRTRVLLRVADVGNFETTPDRASWQQWDPPAGARVGSFVPSPDDRWLAGVPVSRPLLVAKGGVEKPRALGVDELPGRAATR